MDNGTNTYNTVEGIIDGDFCVGVHSYPTDFISDIPVENINGNLYVRAADVRAMFLENVHLKSIIYQEATDSRQQHFARALYLYNKYSPKSVAAIVNNISETICNKTKFNPNTAYPVQHIYRLLYTIFDNHMISDFYRDKPKDLSKLKWIWQENQLFVLVNCLLALKYVLLYMRNHDEEQFFKYLDQLAKDTSK